MDCQLEMLKTPVSDAYKPLPPEFSQHAARAVDQSHPHSNPPIPPRNETRRVCPFITLMHFHSYSANASYESRIPAWTNPPHR